MGLRRVGLGLAVAAGCFGLARLGLLTVSRETRTVALWPTGGLLLGLLLVCERREWPWLALVAAAGSAGAQVVAGRSVPVAVGLGAATCAAGWLGAAGVRRFVGVPVRLDMLAAVLRFALAVSVASGVAALLAAGVIAVGFGTGYWRVWLLWWLADAVGILVLAPVVLVTVDAARGAVRVRRSRLVEGVLVLAGLAAVAAAIFTRPVGATRLLLDFVFPVIPFLFWSALRYGSRGVPFANLVLWVIAGAGTAAGRGPFAGPASGVAAHLLQLESFLVLAVLGVLVGGALADELRQRQESLAASNLRLRRESELLRKAEQRFRELLETAPDAIVIVDHAGVVVLVNAQVERLFGYRREELIGHTVELLVPEHDRARYVALREAFCADHSMGVVGRGIELCAVRKDGRELPVEVTLGTLETDAGVLVSVAVRDISERRRLVDQLEQRGRLMDLVHDAIIVREPASGRISYWNRGAEELYGYVAAEACGRNCDLLLGTEFPEPREAISRVLLERGRWEGELWQVGKHGQRILVSSRQALQRDDRGGPVAVIELNSDITQQRQVEDAQRRLAAMVEHSDDAVLGVTSDGIITEWNRGAERLYGYSKAEAIGRNVQMLVPSELFAERQEMLDRVFGGQALEQYETVRIRKDASRVNVSVTVSPVRDRRGTIVAALSIGRDITEKKRFEGQLQHLADHDHLTGLFNRRRFEEELRREIARAHRYDTEGSVLAIDIDHFKYVNDSLGHAAGDDLIATLANTLRTRLRETDVIARIGGDEFAVILPGVDERQASVVANELLDAVRAASRIELPPTAQQITASIGVAPFGHVAELTSDDLLVEADIAMYDAKEAGRDGTATYSSTEGREGRMKARLTWTDRIRHALAEDRFVLHAQPILALNGDPAPRHELLLRMVGDDGELIPPALFLYIAERMDLIQDIDQWVLHHATRLLAREQRASRNLVLEVNLSAKSIGDPRLPNIIADELNATSADGSGLCIEVTETAAIVNIDRAKRCAAQLAELGCQFALDDFGAGFASFYYLKHFPFDYIKIDGEYIRGIRESVTDQLVVKSLVDIAHGLGKRTIAEFVTDGETLALLREYEIDYAQGFHISHSRPLTEIDLAHATEATA